MSVSAHHCLLWSAEDVAVRFLESLAVGDAEIAEHFLAPEVRYRYGPLWSRHGRDEVSRKLRRIAGDRSGFDVAIHDIDGDDQIVRTHRTDHLRRGPLHLQFAVRGEARIRDGKIVDWEDRITAGVVVSGFGRGLCGAVVPGLRPSLPSA